MKMINFKKFTELWLAFFKIGVFTFGGGVAMLPILERELADKRGWTDTEELLDFYAIGQSTPGIIAVNVSTFLGYKQAGILGGIIATLAVITPSIIIITLIATFLKNFSEIRIIQKAMAGINVGVAAMLTHIVVNFCKKSVRGIFGIAMFLIAFSMLYFFNLNTIWVIFFGAAAGIIAAYLSGELKGAEE